VGAGGGEKNISRFLPNRPPPLSSFDTHAKWQPVTQSARSRRSYGKIGDCEKSTKFFNVDTINSLKCISEKANLTCPLVTDGQQCDNASLSQYKRLITRIFHSFSRYFFINALLIYSFILTIIYHKLFFSLLSGFCLLRLVCWS